MAANTEQNSQLIAQAARELAMANDPTREKVSLWHVERVRSVAGEYLDECAQTGTMPTVRGCAARLGLTRNALYNFAERHPGSEFSEWLQDFSDLCGEVMMAAAMQGSLSAMPCIFVAKSRHGYREAPVQIELQANSAVGVNLPEEELRKRIAESVVVDDINIDRGEEG